VIKTGKANNERLNIAIRPSSSLLVKYQLNAMDINNNNRITKETHHVDSANLCIWLIGWNLLLETFARIPTKPEIQLKLR
jgi:hypothetical protein